MNNMLKRDSKHGEKSTWSAKRCMRLLVPLLCLVPPWLLLINSVIPFAFMSFWIYEKFNIDSNVLIDKGQLILYMTIGGIGLLNFSNAICLSFRQKSDALADAMLLIRGISILTYPSLIWGIFYSIFIMALGGIRGQYMFFLILACFVLLNLSGAFYAIPFILRMNKEQQLTNSRAFLYIVSELIMGADIIAAYLLAKKTGQVKWVRVYIITAISPVFLLFFLILKSFIL